MAGATIKLQTNIPVTGVIQYADHMVSRNAAPDGKPYPDQIALRGNWDGAGEGRVYLHLALEQELQKLGIVGQRQQNGSLPLLLSQPRVKLCKVEQGTTKKTIVELISHAGAVAQQVQQYTQPVQQPTLYPPAQSQQSLTPAAHIALVPPVAAIAVTTPELVVTMEDCLVLASKIIANAGGDAKENLPQIFTTANTLFIERCKRALFGKTEQVPF